MSAALPRALRLPLSAVTGPNGLARHVARALRPPNSDLARTIWPYALKGDERGFAQALLSARTQLWLYNPALPEQRIDCLSSNFDVMPTLRRAMGFPDLEGVDGLALQDGCRDVVRTTFWTADIDYNIVRELAATGGDSYLRWKCITGDVYRYDLASDPRAIETVDAADFPAEAALSAELDDYLDDARDTIAHTICTVDGVTHG
jgi:hypothetical protein